MHVAHPIFWSRVLHIAVYDAGIVSPRTIVWLAGIACLTMMVFAIL